MTRLQRHLHSSVPSMQFIMNRRWRTALVLLGIGLVSALFYYAHSVLPKPAESMTLTTGSSTKESHRSAAGTTAPHSAKHAASKQPAKSSSAAGRKKSIVDETDAAKEEVQQDVTSLSATTKPNAAGTEEDLLAECEKDRGELLREKDRIAAVLDRTKKLVGQSSELHAHDSTGSSEGGQQRLVLFTFMVAEEMKKIRELAGSIHNVRHSNMDVHQLIIFGFGLSDRERREVSLWRNVDYFDAEEELVGRFLVHGHAVDPDRTQTYRNSPVILLNAMEILLRKYGMVLYLRADLQLDEDSLHRIQDVLEKEGVLLATDVDLSSKEAKSLAFHEFPLIGLTVSTHASYILVAFELQCRRGFQCDPVFRKSLTAAQEKLVAEKKQPLDDYKMHVYNGHHGYFCFLLIRDDILYPFELADRNVADLELHSHSKDGKIVVAIGMPTLTVPEQATYKDVFPIRFLLASMLKSVTAAEWKRFRYVLYIGYDEGDRYFDDDAARQQIATTMQEMIDETEGADVSVEMIRFPYSKGWVTYLWNGLFIHAMKDGCDYFYQVNDDCKLNSEGWTSLYVDKLQEMDDFGVAGPSDPRWGASLLTQAFTSRVHYQIFGRFYPLDIRDWYSDNWITEVYGETYTYKFDSVKIENVNERGTRYNPCDKPKYAEALAEGKIIIQDYLDDQAKDTAEATDGDDTKVLEARLQRELQRGPLMQ